MKLLLALAVVIAVVWLLRSVRRQEGRQHPKGQGKETGMASPPGPQHMLPCAHCGIHLPGPDMVAGSKGHYCSREHLLQSEGQ